MIAKEVFHLEYVSDPEKYGLHPTGDDVAVGDDCEVFVVQASALGEYQMGMVLIRGLPGSGKTTRAKNFKRMGYQHFEADMFFETKNGYVFEPKRLLYAHTWCFNSACEAMKKQHDVVVSNTFTRWWEMEPYVRFAIKHDVDVRIIECFGQFKSIHNIPEETIASMKKRWEDVPEIFSHFKDAV